MPRPKLGKTPPCSNNIHGCKRDSLSHKTLVCGPCYSSVRYHLKLGTAHVIQWQQRLHLYLGRARSVSTGNVKAIKRAAHR